MCVSSFRNKIKSHHGWSVAQWYGIMAWLCKSIAVVLLLASQISVFVLHHWCFKIYHVES